MSKLKFGWGHYWKPTPKKIRKFADALSAAALTVSAIAFTSEHKVFAYITLASAFIGKFLSNLFAEEDGQANDRKD